MCNSGCHQWLNSGAQEWLRVCKACYAREMERARGGQPVAEKRAREENVSYELPPMMEDNRESDREEEGQ